MQASLIVASPVQYGVGFMGYQVQGQPRLRGVYLKVHKENVLLEDNLAGSESDTRGSEYERRDPRCPCHL